MNPFKSLEFMLSEAATHGHIIAPTQEAMHTFLWEQYQRLGSCRRVGPLVGMSCNCIQQHLRAAGYPLPTSGGRRWHNPDLAIEFQGQRAHYLAFRDAWHPDLTREVVYQRVFQYGWPVKVAFRSPPEMGKPMQERIV
jgi:hypothetical protein